MSVSLSLHPVVCESGSRSGMLLPDKRGHYLYLQLAGKDGNTQWGWCHLSFGCDFTLLPWQLPWKVKPLEHVKLRNLSLRLFMVLWLSPPFKRVASFFFPLLWWCPSLSPCKNHLFPQQVWQNFHPAKSSPEGAWAPGSLWNHKHLEENWSSVEFQSAFLKKAHGYKSLFH